MFSTVIGAAMMMQSLDATGTALARPIGEAHLEPVSGSYFQVFEFYGRPPHTWRHAEQMVKGYLHDGREGHLAFVKEGATHYFLILNFDLIHEQKMWIGLSAQCNDVAELNWLDGSSLQSGSFRAWSSVAQKKVRDGCNARRNTGTELPVFYEPSEFGVRWEVGEPNTNLKYMMVEFPVPKEDGDNTESQ